MECPLCKTANPDGARFCKACAAPLVRMCSACGALLPEDARFCTACAKPVALPQRERPPGLDQSLPGIAEAMQRLVPKEYAQRLLAARGAVAHQRRNVTILFCDIKGSSAIASSLDPEEVLDIVNGAFECLIPPIFHYEGTLTQLMGDAILAFFGAPIAHEDDPERACLAALDILAAVREYAARLERERGITGFNVRVGINTGPVVVGEVGTDLRVAYTAVGDAINMAARMEQAAEPGTVLVSEETHQLVAPSFETESLGNIPVKGREEPMAVYRVLALKALGKVRGIEGLRSPLVGRDAEVSALGEALERLKAGVGGIVTVVGEAGLGKSRLVAESRGLPPSVIASAEGAKQSRPDGSEIAAPATRARNDRGKGRAAGAAEQDRPLRDGGVHWLEGRCLSYGASIAYLLWLDVLRALLGVTAEDSPLEVLGRLRERALALCGGSAEGHVPYLARLMSLPMDPDTEALLAGEDGQHLKDRTFAAVEELLRGAVQEKPLVLVCEDLHWAGPTSLELLERLLGLTDRAALLLILVFRPEPAHGCWALRETIRRAYRHRHTDLELRPLSSGDTQTLVGNLLQMEQLPSELRQRIIAAAEGNPFFVEEVIRSLMDSGAIARDATTGRWVVADQVAAILIPDTLQGVLLARLDRLDEDTRRVLQMAAVIGRVFLYRLLGEMAAEQRELDGHLLTLQRQEMIRERARIPELEYIFKHELTREAAYNGLLMRDRRAFHGQVAEALERLFPERMDEQLGLLAHHWERAEVVDKATEYLLRAGDQARLAYAHHEASDYYLRALRLQEGQEDTQGAARTWMKLGSTYHTAFDFRRSREAYDQGFALWQRTWQPSLAVGAAPHPLRLQESEPTALDPSHAKDSQSGVIVGQLFSALVEFTEELDVVPDAARSWDILDGGRTYVFHLREGMLWSDNRPVTAGDFMLSLQRAVDHVRQLGADVPGLDIKGARAYVAGQIAHVAQIGVSAPDDLTLVIELEEPAGYFLQQLTLAYPVPRHALAAHGESWAEPDLIVTNGPFLLKEYRPAERLVLERNPRYHGRTYGNVQTIEVGLVRSEPNPRLDTYQRGELDAAAISVLGPPGVEQARQRYAGEYVSAPRQSVFFTSFDITRAPFDDTRVRLAFVLAADREAIMLSSRGYARPATGGFVPPGIPGHSPGIALPYDPTAARALLAQAGDGPGRTPFPPVEIWHWSGSVVADPVNACIQQWQENLGVEVLARSAPWPDYLKRLDQSLTHLWFSGWSADYPDPDTFLRVGLSQYRRNWPKLPYEELLETARRITDQPRRMLLYRQADRMVIEDALVMPMAYGVEHSLVKPWVKRYPLSPFGAPLWKDVVIVGHG